MPKGATLREVVYIGFKKTNKNLEETNKNLKETNKNLKKTNKNLGKFLTEFKGFNNNISQSNEHEVVALVYQHLTEKTECYLNPITLFDTKLTAFSKVWESRLTLVADSLILWN